MAQSKGSTSLYAVLPENSWLLKYHASLKKQTVEKSRKKKIVSVNFSHALFSMLDFLTLEDGTYRLS